jgi:hypothetical protein
LHTLVDRVQYKETKGGGVPIMIVATYKWENLFRETMKNCLLEVVDDLRNKEEAKKKQEERSPS